MGALTRRTSGVWQYQFHDKHGRRRSVSLGKVSKTLARRHGTLLDALVASHLSGLALDRSAAVWLGELDQKSHNKLAGVGLVAPRTLATEADLQLANALASDIEKRTDIKQRARDVYLRTADNLAEYFGVDQRIDELNQA